jgi:SAM-dependent methyltransferase
MTVTLGAPPALSLFDQLLLKGSSGESASLTMHDPLGGSQTLDAAAWCRRSLPGDVGLVSRCWGPTLDVGCGPGRLTAALNDSGVPALGIDVSRTAVRLTRLRGASALRRDVFSAVPGQWSHVLLADGNIGIGGDPARLLRRCRELLAPGGHLHVEVAAPDVLPWSGAVRISTSDGLTSSPFAWAVVTGDALRSLALGFFVGEVWQEAGRCFMTLVR